MPIPNTQNFYTDPNPIFQHATRSILSITQDNPALVTTTFDGATPGQNQYITGLTVRMRIPNYFGMVQLNEVESVITVINSTQFTIDVDTTSFDPFVIPTAQPGNIGTPAQAVPVGEVNSMLTGAFQNVLRR